MSSSSGSVRNYVLLGSERRTAIWEEQKGLFSSGWRRLLKGKAENQGLLSKHAQPGRGLNRHNEGGGQFMKYAKRFGRKKKRMAHGNQGKK